MRNTPETSKDCYDELTEYLIENQDRFYRLAFSYAGNKEDSLDIVQNAICRALDHYESLRNREAMKTWFYRILVNESYTLLRGRKRENMSSDEEALENIPYYETGYETQTGIWDQINALPGDMQTVIKLRFFEELSLMEIAGTTGMNLNTVKSKLYRALRVLRQECEGNEDFSRQGTYTV